MGRIEGYAVFIENLKDMLTVDAGGSKCGWRFSDNDVKFGWCG